jgi:hypothetical protein
MSDVRIGQVSNKSVMRDLYLIVIFRKTLGASESTYLALKIKKRRDLQP